MDFYDDSLSWGNRPAVLLHASSWPPAAAPLQQWRINSRRLSKLTSIPEVSEQQLEDWKRPATYAAAFSDTSSTHSSICSQQMFPEDMDDVPVQPQQQLRKEMNEAHHNISSIKDMHSRTSSASGSAVDDVSFAADETTAAAFTWATNIRHFTDCVPLSPDSVCSSSSYCSLIVGVKDNSSSNIAVQPQQQQQAVQSAALRQPQQHRSSPFAGLPAAAAPCSLPNSSSSTSLVPMNDSAAAGEAAVQASLLEALHEMDELEYLPFDRVALWLEAQAATAAAAGTSSSRNLLASTSDDDDSNEEQQQQQQQAVVINSSSYHDSNATAANPPQQREEQEKEEPLFDAPDWWQEAVIARLQQQRDAFQGSWWSRAKVLVALAAQKAACILQI